MSCRPPNGEEEQSSTAPMTGYCVPPPLQVSRHLVTCDSERQAPQASDENNSCASDEGPPRPWNQPIHTLTTLCSALVMYLHWLTLRKYEDELQHSDRRYFRQGALDLQLKALEYELTTSAMHIPSSPRLPDIIGLSFTNWATACNSFIGIRSMLHRKCVTTETSYALPAAEIYRYL